MLAMGIFMIPARGAAAGVGIIAFFFFVYYGIFLFHIYIKNKNSFPRIWIYISVIGLFLICSISLIVALTMESYNDYVGFSIFYLVLNLLILVYSYYSLQRDIVMRNEEPLYFSPWIFPIFKYSSEHKIIKINNLPVVLFFFSILMLFSWTISLIIWVKPV